MGRTLYRVPSVDSSSIRIGFDAMVDRMGFWLKFSAEVDGNAMIRLVARENAGPATVPLIVAEEAWRSDVMVEASRVLDITETFYVLTFGRRFSKPLVHSLLT